ncbi:MAG: SUMF1/EgtB/PvdO family nonheme iron enzyme [Kiritimatiellia bacterium]|nr:SUMF1/EgtB/PvdO family nonheme iron enzyme [Kiritimatiellia bacterium]
MNKLLSTTLLLKALLVVALSADAVPLVGEDWMVPESGIAFVWIKALGGWVGKYEITNEEFREFHSEHRSHWPPRAEDAVEYCNHDFLRRHSLDGADHPVVMVGFDDAEDYAEWLTNREREAGRLPSGYVYRLPTLDEWRLAARCGMDRRYPWGDEWPPSYGNFADDSWRQMEPPILPFISGYSDGHIATCPVQAAGENDWGLFGIGGNTTEMATTHGNRIHLYVGSSFISAQSHLWTPIDFSIVAYDGLPRAFIGFRLVLLPALPQRARTDLPSKDDIIRFFHTHQGDALVLSSTWETYFHLKSLGCRIAPLLLVIAAEESDRIAVESAIGWLRSSCHDLRPYRRELFEIVERGKVGAGSALIAIETYAGPKEAVELFKLIDGAEEEALRSGIAMRILDIAEKFGSEDIKARAAAMRPKPVPPPPEPPEHARPCISQLLLIRSAKEQWAMENRKPEGHPATVADLAPFFRGGIFPVCPNGGAYEIGPVGANPTCTQPDHVLE